MRILLIAAGALILPSCASFDTPGPMRTYSSIGGQSFQSMDPTNPHFYMDNDEVPSSNRASTVPPIPRGGIDVLIEPLGSY